MSMLKAGRPSTSNKQKAMQDVQEQKEEVVKMVINVPRGFHRQIKQIALNEDTTVTELVNRSIREYINKETNTGK